MKKLKFRAWNNEHNKMYKVHSLFLDRQGNVTGIHFIAHGGITTADVKSPYMEGIAVKVMQFTGLLDKNGKEIHEGDIVKVLNVTYEGKVEKERIGHIGYNDKKCCFYLEYSDERYGFKEGRNMTVGQFEEFEIIGNIYENSELLK